MSRLRWEGLVRPSLCVPACLLLTSFKHSPKQRLHRPRAHRLLPSAELSRHSFGRCEECMFSHFCPHLPGTQRLKRLRAARCGASESCKYYSSFPPLLLLPWARYVEIPIITTKPSLCHLDDSPHMAKILFAVLSAEQWSSRPCSYGKPICAKQICTSSFVTRGSGCKPLLRWGLESHSSTRQRDTDECQVLPEVDGCWGSGGVNMVKDSRRANTPQNKTKRNRTSNWTLWKTQQHRIGNHTFAISARSNSILPGSELRTKRWNAGCHNPTRLNPLGWGQHQVWFLCCLYCQAFSYFLSVCKCVWVCVSTYSWGHSHDQTCSEIPRSLGKTTPASFRVTQLGSSESLWKVYGRNVLLNMLC